MAEKKLTDCPSNLKEAIDWILRVTGKDGGSSGTKDLAAAVTGLLKEVESYTTELEKKLEQIKEALKPGGTNGIITALGNGLKTFRDEIHIAGSGASNKNVYQELSNGDLKLVPKAGEIFLGCVPLCFYGLSYLYWRCSDGDVQNGGWKTHTLDGAYQNNGLHWFMIAAGYQKSQLSYKQGTDVVSEAMTEQKFKDLKTALAKAQSAARTRATKEDEARTKLGVGKSHTPGEPGTPIQANQNPTYPEYLHELCGKWCNKPSTFTPSNDSSLSALYYVSYLYFKGKQSALTNDPDFKPRPPSTIREMLYFLAALPFSHSYDEFDKYITQHFKIIVGHPDSPIMSDAELMIPVADSASVNTNNTLSAADLKDYLITTCHYSATLLSVIQGNSGSENPDEPWLHGLYSNGMKFKYPSGSMLFHRLADYTYALQFQLYFLYTQCYSTYTAGCGWNQCQYGSEINKTSNTAVPTHICAGFKCGDQASSCNHGRSSSSGNAISNCNHNKKGEGCGQGSNVSPL
ncbi:variant erythrocyte surface antigen-1 family protein [Babesia caballi]|uniref:Variant erythrocyte surface antigen-1 family protein n=1 Tax=Babesia caballi TaxID=5871 RepID=A0AAV4LMZ7_BABCB|nr:variant erythrocyte surface antigen-1 family protein [Babesia caballi]